LAAQVDEENAIGSEEPGSTNDSSSAKEKKEISRSTTENEKVAA